MEEIALVFSSLAGACTAVALDKIPKIKRNKQTPTINSAITNQLHSLRMEKEILSKTITRLHQQESDVTKIQKDKLLLRYQHQLGTVITKIEKLEVASKYPDLGQVGDSLISLMDNKLSQLDQRLHEISSKITVNTITQPKQVEKPMETILESTQVRKIEPKIEIQKEKIEIQEKTTVKSERTSEWLPPIEVPTHEKHRTVELSTLTEITSKIPQFPADLIRPAQIEPQVPQVIIEPILVEEPIQVPHPNTHGITEEILPEIPKPESIQQESERKIQLPAAIKIPEEEKLEDDDKDLDKIKSEIMKALSKLEQVEVE
ncbi:hypothetical protein [Candidatus Nitrosotalea okcheonensis]|uniref:Uncharacterized protein n=1 Tax=Candidatus Nitrosotalea okcheonensis TaxID=1903276 RepID=A0A2H1FGG8_9ARCH|nr:hypothetical protein [Candidatus Nitrosotalea okcheonensis]SMH71860.1 conserved exported protein of unknown function [Candidatus Nitrosotalea okcheonensis]